MDGLLSSCVACVWEKRDTEPKLGLAPMTEDYQGLGDKESLSPASQPLYLRLQFVTDPEPLEPVEHILSSDREEYSINVSDRSLRTHKRTKLRFAPWYDFWLALVQALAQHRQDKVGTHRNGHGSSGTPPCGKFRCSHYQNDKKRTGIQTSGKSP